MQLPRNALKGFVAELPGCLFQGKSPLGCIRRRIYPDDAHGNLQAFAKRLHEPRIRFARLAADAVLHMHGLQSEGRRFPRALPDGGLSYCHLSGIRWENCRFARGTRSQKKQQTHGVDAARDSRYNGVTGSDHLICIDPIVYTLFKCPLIKYSLLHHTLGIFPCKHGASSGLIAHKKR